MFCYKCGCELPNDAMFCFKCGSKTMNSTEMITEVPEKEIIDDIVNICKVGADEITFSQSESKELMIRSVFEKNAELSSRYLYAYGAYEIHEFEALYTEYYSAFTNIVDKNCSIAARFLMKLGVVTYDKNTLLNLATNAMNLEDGMKAYYNDLEKVELQASEFSNDAEARSKIKDPWRGGGFGFSGAILGAIQADILNAGSNFIGRIEDGIINAIDRRTLNKLKQECLESLNAVEALSHILYDFVCKLGEIIYAILINEKIALENKWIPLNQVIAKRNNLIDLYQSKEMTREEVLTELLNCFKENPFQVYTIADMYRLDNDGDFELTLLAKMIGSPLWAYANLKDMEYHYTELYYYMCIRDEESNLPELFDGMDVVDKIKNNQYTFDINFTEDEYINNNIYDLTTFKADFFRVCRDKFLPKETFLNAKQNFEIAEIFSNEQLFDETVVQLIIINGLEIPDAIEFVLDTLVNAYNDENVKGGIKELKKVLIDAFAMFENQFDISDGYHRLAAVKGILE